MIRTMLDSDKLDILSTYSNVVDIVATYSDLFPSETDVFMYAQKLGGAKLVLFDRGLGDPSNLATIFDIERGTLTIDQAKTRFETKMRAGFRYLTLYCNRSNLAAVQAQIPGGFHMVATLDGTAFIAGYTPVTSPCAVQCLPESLIGIHADLSLVYEDYWNPTS